MKKILGIVMVLTMVFVGTAYAVDAQFSGDYYVRGKWWDNSSGIGDNTESFAKYDHELNLNMNFKVNDATSVFTRWEINDENFGEGGVNEGDTAIDDNIYAERVWLQHAIGPGALKLGLMAAGAWATVFGDAGDEAYRIRYDLPTDFATFIGILEKLDNGETGSDDSGDDDDQDAYVLGIITKMGVVNVKPLFVYVDFGDAADMNAFTFDLALDANFDAWAFEFETNIDYYDVDDDDYTVWGAYLNAWMNMGPAKLGALFAYGSYEDEGTKDFGGDADGFGAQLLGNEFAALGDNGDAMDGAAYIAVYLDYAVTEQFSIGPHIGYAWSVYDEGIWEDASAWEVSIDGSYKLSDAVTYSFGAGIADVDMDDDDPDSAAVIWHKFAVAF